MNATKIKCEFCSKMFSKYGIKNHIAIMHLKTRERPKPKNAIWNKGLTKENDDRLKKSNDTYKKNFADGKFKGSFSNKKHNKETKEKISKSIIKFLHENPDKVPYKLNHYSNEESYPEKYFKELFEKENILLTKEYPVSIYQLDFADIKNKIDIEIDGEQHYQDDRIIQSDLKRTSYLEELGWKIIRIRWSKYKKLKLEERKEFIKNLKASLAEWS